MLWFILFREFTPVFSVPLAVFKNELADAGTGVKSEGGVAEINDLKYLLVRYSGLNKACRDMYREAEAGKPAPSLKPTADIVGQRDLFLGYPKDHLSRVDSYIFFAGNRNSFGYIGKI